MFRTDLGAALRDVAVTQARLFADEVATVVLIERMHLELGVADEEPRSGVVLLIVLVIANDVADVLAHEALDALAELLAALDVFLEHAIPAFGHGRRHESGNLR